MIEHLGGLVGLAVVAALAFASVISGGQVGAGSQGRVRTPMDKSEGAPPLGGGAGLNWVRATYDFAADGGAVGNINLIGRTDIPSGARILGGFIDIVTQPTSGTSTAQLRLSLEANGDVEAATVITNAQWNGVKMTNIIPRFNDATTWLKTTAVRDIVLAISVEALTAGKFDVYLAYLPPTDAG
jgi:hypothetical protein